MIKTIIFDLSEVIIAGYKGIEYIIEKAKGIPANVFVEKRRENCGTLWSDVMRGKITFDEYIEQLFAGTNWEMSADEFKKYFRQNLDIAVECTWQVVEKLRGKYRLILLSDHVEELTGYILKKYKELKLFEKIIWSYEIGQIKTDAGTFEKVLDMLEIKAEETLFIDDNARYIDNANSAGINTILFTSAKELEKELSKLKLI